jgi:hypothetical protein
MSQRSPTLIRGVEYPSQTAAARALGIAQSGICKHLDRGTIDTTGLGRVTPPGRSVTIGGTQYTSIAQAARSTGQTRDVIKWAMRKPVTQMPNSQR